MPTQLRIALSLVVLAVLILVWFAAPVTARHAAWFRLGDRDPFYALARSRPATRIAISVLAVIALAILWLVP